jgi:hypothetical protein
MRKCKGAKNKDQNEDRNEDRNENRTEVPSIDRTPPKPPLTWNCSEIIETSGVPALGTGRSIIRNTHTCELQPKREDPFLARG